MSDKQTFLKIVLIVIGPLSIIYEPVISDLGIEAYVTTVSRTIESFRQTIINHLRENVANFFERYQAKLDFNKKKSHIVLYMCVCIKVGNNNRAT